jgi:flagellar biosynthesis/type III secretory pathway protein FliH
MDLKKFIADLAAGYRKLTGYEAGRKAGHDAGRAEGYEAGRKAGHDEAMTPPEPPPSPEP